jgi:hypothetical protein
MEDLPTERRCKKCNQPNRKQCSQCSGKSDPNAAAKRYREEEKATGVTDARLTTIRENSRKSKKSRNKAAKSYGFIVNQCKGPDGKTGSTCQNTYQARFSGKGVFFCATCHKAAKGPEVHANVLAAKRAKLAAKDPLCKGIDGNGRACRSHLNGKYGILLALRKAGLKVTEARAFMQSDIPQIVAAFEQSELCLSCFKKEYPQHGQGLTAITACSGTDSAGVPCRRAAHRNGLCESHFDATQPAKSCRGISGDFKCDSGAPASRRRDHLCKPCFQAKVAQVAAATPLLRRPPRKKQKHDRGEPSTSNSG